MQVPGGNALQLKKFRRKGTNLQKRRFGTRSGDQMMGTVRLEIKEGPRLGYWKTGE
jgi:hypothetical protein